VKVEDSGDTMWTNHNNMTYNDTDLYDNHLYGNGNQGHGVISCSVIGVTTRAL